MVDASLFNQLKSLDTPTVCNALEMLDPGRRAYGFTTESLFCLRESLAPIVGYAKTATMRSLQPSTKSSAETVKHRVEYYTYISEGSERKVCVMQDLDSTRVGTGAFWGTFNSSIHKALGCEGVVTDGAIRDVQKIPESFQMIARGVRPSHGYVHVVDFGIQVNVCSMVVNDGDLVHADIHGAVCFSASMANDVINAAVEFVEGERPIIEACQESGIEINRLIEIYRSRVS